MTLNILILIGIVVLLFLLKKRVGVIQGNVESKIEDINSFAIKPVQKAIGAVSSFFSNRKKKRK